MGKKKSKKDTSNKKNRPQNGVQKTNNKTSGDRGTSKPRNEGKDSPSLEKGKESSTEQNKTGEGFNAVKFFQESKDELEKVVWPSRQQLISESAAVVLMVTLVATTIYFVDNLFVWLSGKVF
ncbi:MAG: preprotein translocase subunit SecE [Cyanobacteria bacterium SBLK]|nr:preprotein translocase subunit SecE [Cyanobacteria bacterium SBLK]